jgi:hypothetical protein
MVEQSRRRRDITRRGGRDFVGYGRPIDHHLVSGFNSRSRGESGRGSPTI